MASMILSAVSAFGFVMILIYMAISRKDNPATAASDGSVTESVAN